MRGLMMDYPLTIPAILRRAETLFGSREVVSRRSDKTLHRYSYADMIRRAKKLGVALTALGVRPGDRVATLSWNHFQHLETYFGIPGAGAVLHTLNLRLHPEELSYIVNHAEDSVAIVDRSLLPLFDELRAHTNIRRVIVMGDGNELPAGAIDYEELLESADACAFDYDLVDDEHSAAAMCYTSGTTGRSKGVVYSHRALVLHCLNWTGADSIGIRGRDTILAAPPMFHITGWGLPFIAPFAGAKLVLPGRHLDAASLLELIDAERVTFSAGVPTIWLGVLQALEAGAPYEVSTLHTLASGGSAVPKSLIKNWQERYGVTLIHIWGMTEMTAGGTIARCPPALADAPVDVQYTWRTKQGVPNPFYEIRARGDAGLVPWDGETMGELEVRGPMVATAYYRNENTQQFTDDHWLRTGDIGTIDEHGCVELRDRSKDLIKSGGEWISSVGLENALMGHPAVAEAAVVAIPDRKWGERPLAVVVVKAGHTATSEELRAHLAPSFPRWSLPDAFEFVNEIPKTSTGKFLKSALRDRYSAFHDAAGSKATSS
jgi:fatty-acyl-CoA synthase